MNPQDEILEIFRADAKEHLSQLNFFLLELEKNPNNLPSFDGILRSIHTLKGDSRMVGLEEVGRIAHKIEDVLKALHSGILLPGEENISLLLDGTFFLEDFIFGGSADPEKISRVISNLENILGAPPKKASGNLLKKLTGVLGRPSTPLPKIPAPPDPPSPKPSKPAPPARATESSGSLPSAVAKPSGDTIRIKASFLDTLLNLLGELTINREKITSLYYQLRNIANPLLKSDNGLFGDEQKRDLKGLLEEFYENTGDYYHLTTELQSQALEIRMLPLATLFQEYPVMVRSIGRELGKKINLVIEGEETQLDKYLLETIRPALTHLIRNAIDHGIEPIDEREQLGKSPQGKISLRAYPKGNHVLIEIEDDGRGIDEDKVREKAQKREIMSEERLSALKKEDLLNLILTPGFSTKEVVTDISGRGIGMDVVANTVEKLKGHISLESEKGVCTRFTLQIPMTLTIMQALLVTSHGEIVAIPLSFVQETQVLFPSQLKKEGGAVMFNLRGSYVPLFHLARILQFSDRVEQKKKYLVAILKFKDELLGVVVDKFLREQEIVIKTLGDFLDSMALVAGTTILRRGDPAMILNVYDVFQKLRYHQLTEDQWESEEGKESVQILVVDDSLTVRTVQKTVLEKAGYQVDTADSAEEALEKTARKLYNLVVTDVQMGEMDGFGLTRTLREDSRYRDIPIIMITSLAKEEDRKKGLEVGAQAYIVKSSYDQKNLLETVRALIGKA